MLAGCPVENLCRSEPYNQPLTAKLPADRSRQRPQPPGNNILISLFAKTVQDLPKQSAVEVKSGFRTFRKVSGKSNAVRIPSIEIIIAMLGILKAGAAYCPIDVDSPGARIREVVEEIGARIVVGDHHYRERLLHSV